MTELSPTATNALPEGRSRSAPAAAAWAGVCWSGPGPRGERAKLDGGDAGRRCQHQQRRERWGRWRQWRWGRRQRGQHHQQQQQQHHHQQHSGGIGDEAGWSGVGKWPRHPSKGSQLGCTVVQFQAYKQHGLPSSRMAVITSSQGPSS